MSDDWRKDAELRLKRMPQKGHDVRDRAKADLYFFAKLVNPGYMYGHVHRDIFKWMEDYELFGQGEGLADNKLIMLPRAHLKSHMVATWCAWIVTRHPEVTILYVSATADLAQTQLYAVKNILGSTIYQRYFPEYLDPQEGKRDKWSSVKVSIDHIKRSEEGIRDATISTAGLTTNTTGWHADIVIGDDLVVPENAYTEDGRESVSKKSSQFTSIRNAGGFTMACGTRYHPSDIYDTWAKQFYDVFNDEFEVIDRAPVWDIKEYSVEVDGQFIWPRAVRSKDDKAFGFDPAILARIKAEYSDQTQFFAQYYNDPNDPASERISREAFQYYDRKHLKRERGNWWFKGKRLNVYAAVDFAFSLSKRADSTAIVVIGIDSDGDVYVLDIERFKSDRTIDYFRRIVQLHSKWSFKRLRAEVTVAQQIIVNDIKDHVRKEGMKLSIDEFRPSKAEGNKEERINAALEHRYMNNEMWHFEGGYTNVLEEELVQARPAHDDVKDALASAVEIAIKPKQSSAPKDMSMFASDGKRSRFGGMKFK